MEPGIGFKFLAIFESIIAAEILADFRGVATAILANGRVESVNPVHAVGEP